MSSWARIVVEVSDSTGKVQGWMIGADGEFDVLPHSGDMLEIGQDRAATSLGMVLGSDTLTVLRRHFRTRADSRSGPMIRIVVGAPQSVDLELLERRDEWIEYSTRATSCAYGGCVKDHKREADSALWTCTTSGHNLCLACDRPVRGSCVFCAYHDPSEL